MQLLITKNQAISIFFQHGLNRYVTDNLHYLTLDDVNDQFKNIKVHFYPNHEGLYSRPKIMEYLGYDNDELQ